MRLFVKTSTCFIFGFIFTAGYGLEIEFGWIGFGIIWCPPGFLEDLPQMEHSPCKDCGRSDWKSCNPHPEGGFHDCNFCRGTEGGPDS